MIKSNNTGETCVTILNMIEEYEKGPEGDFYPYIKYLYGGHEGGTTPGLLPTTWSDEAKNVLQILVGKQLIPRQIEFPSVFSACRDFIPPEKIEAMSPETKQRYEDGHKFLISRSWDDKMVPILDMINHRNGTFQNVWRVLMKSK
jgi:hypothetical protein